MAMTGDVTSRFAIPRHVPPKLVIDFDIAADPQMTVDVFARLAQVRDSAPPIAWSPHNGGHWLFFREKDIQTAFIDDHFSTALFTSAAVGGGSPDMIPLCLDPPDHLPWRMVVVRQLAANKMRRLEDAIRRKAEELIRPLAGRNQVEYVSAVGEQMPISIFMSLMGLPLDGFAEFRAIALQIISPPDGDRRTPATAQAFARILTILAELIEERRHEPRNDFISALLQEEVRGEPIGAKDLLAICYVLFIGGLDTVVNAMSFGMRFLALDQTLQDQVRADRTMIPDLVEQLLRKSAFVNPMRLVKSDVVVNGVQLKAGDIVWNITATGSNEPGGETGGQRHLAFGGGHHMCAGMHLARLELRVMYETWFEHIGRFTLVDGDPPVMSGGPSMQMKRLPLNLAP